MPPKEKIPVAVRNSVWSLYIGSQYNSMCLCCNFEPITKSNFECGHIVSEKNGGKVHLLNLRPICSACNKSIGTRNMEKFMKQYGFVKNKNWDGINNIQNEKKNISDESIISDKNNISNESIISNNTSDQIIHKKHPFSEDFSEKNKTITRKRQIIKLSDALKTNAYSYTESINYKDMIRLDVIDPLFIFENLNDMPITTSYTSKYILNNGNKILDERTYFLFDVGKDMESQKIFKLIKECKVNKIFDGKCELFIESEAKPNVRLLSFDEKPCLLPNFIIKHVASLPVFDQLRPEDLVFNEVLKRRTHKSISELMLLLPSDDYIATIVNKNIIIYYYNTLTQLYELIGEDRLRAAIQKVVLDFTNTKYIATLKIFSELTKNISSLNEKAKNIDEKIKDINKNKCKNKKTTKKQKNPEKTKLKNELKTIEEEINKLSDEINVYNNMFEDFGKLIKDLETTPFMDNVTKSFITEKQIFQKHFDKKLDERKDVWNFIDGIFELRTGVFRKRTKDDYYTETVDYNYGDGTFDPKIMEEIDLFVSRICNDDIKITNCYNHWLGYCMTGEISMQKCLWSIGLKASNGKSTLVKIFSYMGDIYCVELDPKTFDMGYQGRHKQFSILKNVRMASLDEIDQKKIDVVAFKICIEGNQILYGTAESMQIYFKIIITSNKYPKFKQNADVMRRGYCINHANEFLTGKKYETNKHLPNVYEADDTIAVKFRRPEYKIALFHKWAPYAKEFYESKFNEIKNDMALLEEGWINNCCENDNMVLFLENNYDITNNNTNRVHKDTFLKTYQDYYNLHKISWSNLYKDVIRVGLTYERQKTINNKKGVIVGIVPKNNKPNQHLDFID